MNSRIALPFFCLCFAAGPVIGAGNITTATITVTNATGTTNGQTITVNGDTRTWTNSVVLPASQILTNSTPNLCATNLFNALADNPIAGTPLQLSWSATNAVNLVTTPGAVETVTLSAGWGTVTYTTNILTSAVSVRVPYTVESGAQQTNIASGLVTAIGSNQNTNSIYESAPVAVHLVGLTNSQTMSGAKTFTGDVFLFGPSNWLSDAWLNAPTTTNLVNYGPAISSRSSANLAEQFGQNSTASATAATALGNLAAAIGVGATAVGQSSTASSNGAVAFGALASASGSFSVAFGDSALATGGGSTALGNNAVATNGNDTAIGVNSRTTSSNQVMLGAAGISTVVNNTLTVQGGLLMGQPATNSTFTGTNSFTGSDIAFTRYALSTLANGNNADLAIGTNIFIEVSGPTGAFTINGITGGRDGRQIILLNQTGQNMTLANQSGVEPTPANRLVCLTGADKSVTGNSAALLLYSAASSRWVVVYFGQ